MVGMLPDIVGQTISYIISVQILCSKQNIYYIVLLGPPSPHSYYHRVLIGDAVSVRCMWKWYVLLDRCVVELKSYMSCLFVGGWGTCEEVRMHDAM